MPLSRRAAAAAGISVPGNANVSLHAAHLRVLGDVFALPVRIPLANVVLFLDLLIAFGNVIAFNIAAVSLGPQNERTFKAGRLAAPLAVRSFRSLACARFVSQTGDWLTMTAVVGWMFATTHSTTNVAAVLLVRMAPPVLGGGLAAVIVDRLPKRPLLVVVEGSRGTGDGVLALLAATTGHTVEMLAVLAVSGLLAPLSAAAVPALVPRLLDEDLYESGNALLGIADNTAAALGAVGGGALVVLLGIRPALGIEVATFGLAALVYVGVRLPPGAASGPPARRAACTVCATSSGGPACSCSWRRSSRRRLRPASSTRHCRGCSSCARTSAPAATGTAWRRSRSGSRSARRPSECSASGSGASRWIGCGLMVMAAFLASPCARPRRSDDLPHPRLHRHRRRHDRHRVRDGRPARGRRARPRLGLLLCRRLRTNDHDLLARAVADFKPGVPTPTGVVLAAAAFLVAVGVVTLVSVIRVSVLHDARDFCAACRELTLSRRWWVQAHRRARAPAHLLQLLLGRLDHGQPEAAELVAEQVHARP